MPAKRAYCPHCDYPQSTCVCHALEPFASVTALTIIQHPKERDHAKNTARLVALAHPDCAIILSDDRDAILTRLQQYTANQTVLIYPSENSVSLESYNQRREIQHLVLLDGSWKQAYGLWRSIGALQSLPCCHFDSAPDTAYDIRHTCQAKGLSTLEATAYALEVVERIDVSPLHKLQMALTDSWQGPAEHRR